MIEKIERYYLEINSINDLKTKSFLSKNFTIKETNKKIIQSLREKNQRIQELEDKIANINKEPFQIDDDLLSQVNIDN